MNKKKVMIIDDEEDFIALARSGLERRGGYETMVFSDPKDILEKINMHKPDVILLDLIMPSVGGLDVCEILNKDYYARRIPIIIVSALGKDVDKLKAYKLGVVDYLVKPLVLDDLIIKIEKALQK